MSRQARDLLVELADGALYVPDTVRSKLRPGQSVLSLSADKRELLKELRSDDLAGIRTDKWMRYNQFAMTPSWYRRSGR